MSPSKKDVRRKRIGVNRFVSHAGHWLESSQVSSISFVAVFFDVLYVLFESV